MSCQNCVQKVEKKINTLNEVSNASIQLKYPQLQLESTQAIALDKIKAILPSYEVEEISTTAQDAESAPSFLQSYKPLFLIVLFILGVSILAQYPFTDFSWMLLMRYFMAGFFIVFAFFKFLNLSGFASSYAMYDIIAGKWKAWGYIYPFIELALGVAYLINFNPLLTGTITIVVLTISSIGVIKSNLDKQKIQCACLGDVFDLPMSVVTIIEDVTMIVMAVIMLLIA